MPKLNTIPARVQSDSVGGIAKVVYDVADLGGKIGNISLELALPSGAIIHRGFIDVVPPLASGGSATVTLSFIGSSTQALLAAPSNYDALTSVHALAVNTTAVKLSSTNATKTSVLNVVIAGADLTAGRFNVYLQYFGV